MNFERAPGLHGHYPNRSVPLWRASTPYANCCGRWHAGPLHLLAPDAEKLMRSRYSAFVLGLDAYLLQTWHASTRPCQIQRQQDLRWLGLEVRRFTLLTEREASVEFIARSKLGGQARRPHEVSRFVSDDGRRYYLDGQIPEAG